MAASPSRRWAPVCAPTHLNRCETAPPTSAGQRLGKCGRTCSTASSWANPPSRSYTRGKASGSGALRIPKTIRSFFNRAQHAQTRLAAYAILPAYDFGQFPTVADLGGGSGAFLVELLVPYPRMRGLLFDLPHVVAEATPILERAGVAARCAVKSGSFFDAVPPGYAAYILKAVFNSFDDTTRLQLLRQVRSVCTMDTRLLVLEYMVGPPNEDPYTKMLDLAMLLRTGGEQHTQDAWAALFATGGFRLARMTPTPFGLCVLEGAPV